MLCSVTDIVMMAIPRKDRTIITSTATTRTDPLSLFDRLFDRMLRLCCMVPPSSVHVPEPDTGGQAVNLRSLVRHLFPQDEGDDHRPHVIAVRGAGEGRGDPEPLVIQPSARRHRNESVIDVIIGEGQPRGPVNNGVRVPGGG